MEGNLTLYPAFGKWEVTLGEVEFIAAYVSDIVEAFAAARPCSDPLQRTATCP